MADVDPVMFGALMQEVKQIAAAQAAQGAQLTAIEAHINKAKGARWAVGALVGALASVATMAFDIKAKLLGHG